MATTWTQERRARQAELIRTWKPWKQATGPRTPEGKAKASANSDKGGAAWKVEREKLRDLKAEVNSLLLRQRDLLSRVAAEVREARGLAAGINA